MRTLFLIITISSQLFISAQTPIVYDWNNSTEGWVSGGNCNLTAQPGALAMRLYSSQAVMRSGDISADLGVNGSDYNQVEVTIRNPTTGSGMARLFLYPPGTNSDTCYYTFQVDTEMSDFQTYTISLDSIPSGGLSAPYDGPIARFGLRAPWGGVNFDTVFWEKMLVSNTNFVVDSTDVTFQVDMSQVTDTFNTPEISGTFNNWCSDCDVMSDVDGDNVWERVVKLMPGDTIEYKFSADQYNIMESLNPNDLCTNGDLNITNRVIIVPQSDISLNVCWESCEPCVTDIIESNIEILIFPNPTSGVLNIQSEKVIDKLELRDVFGRSIMAKKPKTSNFKLDLKQLPNNIYFMSYSVDNAWHNHSIVVSQ